MARGDFLPGIESSSPTLLAQAVAVKAARKASRMAEFRFGIAKARRGRGTMAACLHYVANKYLTPKSALATAIVGVVLASLMLALWQFCQALALIRASKSIESGSLK